MTISIARAAAAVEIRVSDRRDDACALPHSVPPPLADVNVDVVVTEDTFYRSGYYSRRRMSSPSVSRALIIDICAMRFDEGLL